MSYQISDGAVHILAGLLEARTGQQLAVGRRWRIDTALRPLLAEVRASSLDDLAHRVVAGRDPMLADKVIEALLNHETSFCRDARAFQQLAELGFGRLHEARRETRRLRVWSAGCATGQEAYTLAMLFADEPERWADWHIDILGTDLSAAAIERARSGVYTHFEVQRGLPIAQMLRRFEQRDGQWRVEAALRRMVRFQVHNLLDAPPAGRFDAVLCRNVLLYFAGDMRRLVFGRIASAIAQDGALMLGAGETTMGQTDQFVSDYSCRGLYRPRVEPPRQAAAS
ncbi:CheR family methyltransferase [Sphingomonas sp.]|uniref:CheR family methyltransferase n=1 Tax=Sphingomonas sp. TaxID=28214 RepID=UPI003B006F26